MADRANAVGDCMRLVDSRQLQAAGVGGWTWISVNLVAAPSFMLSRSSLAIGGPFGIELKAGLAAKYAEWKLHESAFDDHSRAGEQDIQAVERVLG